MAVVPLRANRPTVEIESDPHPTADATVIIGESGEVQIEYGTSTPQKPEPEPDDDFDRNLALDVDDSTLASLASYLMEGIEADIEARAEWEDTANIAAKYLGIELKDPASSVAADGTVCQAVASCMLEAAIKTWATAVAELLPSDGPVKVKREAPPAANEIPGGGIAPVPPPVPGADGIDAKGDNLADALETDMNWYLTKGDPGYYADFRQMLMSRNIIGMAFREVFRCPLERKPISRWVMAQDLIVEGNPAHINGFSVGRVTKRAKVRQSVMRRMMKMGHYRDVVLVQPAGETSKTEITIGETQGISMSPALPRDFEHTVYECCCELGDVHNLLGSLDILDRDETGKVPGYPLPYRVTMDYDSKTVLSIRRNWKRGDADHRRRSRFVKYGYIPSFGFYDWGLIHIVGNPTQAATMIQRSMVDTSLFANFPAWMRAQGPGSRMETTVFRPNPGEVLTIPVAAGGKLSDSVMPWPYKEPSAQAMAMGSKLENDVSKLAGLVDLPVGEGRIGNTPVGTIMSYIEAVSMVPGAVHKADHAAQAEEFELLRELIAEEPEVLTRGNRSPARLWQAAQEVTDPDLAPAADPNTPSQIHRLTKVQGLVTLGGLQQFALGDKDGPIVNQRAIYRRAAEVLTGSDADEFTLPPQQPQAAPPPPPDPRVVAAQIKAQADQQKGQSQLQLQDAKHQDHMAEIAIESQEKSADRQSEETKAALQLAAGHAGAQHDAAHEANQSAADRAHEVGLEAMKQAAPPPLSGPLTGGENG